MRYLYKSFLLLTAFVLCPCLSVKAQTNNNIVCESGVHDEIDGVVMIEAETTASELGEWEIDTEELNNEFTG